MKRLHIRRGATNTSTVTIIVIVVVIAALLVIGCIGAVLAGIFLPVVGQAREAAMAVRSTAQLRQIHAAYQIWQRDVEDDAVFSFDVLVDGGYVTAEILNSPSRSSPASGADYWYLHPQPASYEVDAADVIIGYDRAMYAASPRVAVLFADGTADVVEVADFEAMLESPPNDEVDFNLPLRQ